MKAIYIIMFAGFMMTMVACVSVPVYENQQVPYESPVYTTQEVPYEAPVYEMRKTPYSRTYTEYVSVPYTMIEQQSRQIPIDPIITESKKIALLRFSGASQEVNEQAIAGFQIGFQQKARSIFYPDNPTRTIEFIRRISLTGALTETQLNELGPNVYKTLRDAFGIDYICTASILQSTGYRLELQMIDMDGKPILGGLDGVFSGQSWEDIGSKVADQFLSMRYETEIAEVEVTKYRNEAVEKTEILYRDERVQTGTTTKYRSEQVKSGSEIKYKMQEVQVGEKKVLDNSNDYRNVAAILTVLIVGGLGLLAGILSIL